MPLHGDIIPKWRIKWEGARKSILEMLAPHTRKQKCGQVRTEVSFDRILDIFLLPTWEGQLFCRALPSYKAGTAALATLVHAYLSSLSKVSVLCWCPTRQRRARAYFLHLLSRMKENKHTSILNHREVVVKAEWENSSQVNATWVTSRFHALSLKHSSTKNVKAKAEIAKRDLNMEATRE